jgi:TonB family protein
MIEQLNQYGQIWAEFFGLVILQNTLFLGIVFLVLYWLRDANAKTKYIITMIGIVKLLLPPFIPASFLSKLFAFSNGIIAVQIGKPMIAVSADQIESTLSLSLVGLLFLIWFLTVSISLLVPIVTTLRLQFKLRDAIPIRFEEIDNASIKIYQSEKINMPLTIGIFSNKIFVPAQWDSWSSECRKMILHHELAHIRRRDGIFKLLQIIDQAIYFFHPLVWILNSRINQLREMACDDVSVATKRNSSMEYSRYLVKIAEKMTLTELGCSSASALIRQKNELLNRVQYQIKEVAMKHISKKKLGGIISILLLSFGLLSFTFSSTPPDEPGNLAVQKTGKVYGNIKDKETGKPIPGAKVGIEGTTLWAASDDEGNYFIINVPPGVYNLEARKDAYKNVIISKVSVNEAQSTKIDFKLEPVLMKISETDEDAPPPPPPAKEKLVKVRETEKGEPPPPPPPPNNEKEVWVDYDNAPKVVGGFGEVVKVLKYPESARKSAVSGLVEWKLQIDEDGKIVESKIKKSLQPDCDKAALEALKSVKWKPALKDGKPVKVWVTVPVKFALK